MATFRVTFADVVAILGIAFVCAPILLFMPPFEQSRTQARIAKAFIDVRQLRGVATATKSEASLEELDPWGKPYRIAVLPDGRIRVLSSGPNESTPTGTIDEDDIYSDMPTNPIKVNLHRQQRQILVVLGLTIGMWILLTGLYLWFRRR